MLEILEPALTETCFFSTSVAWPKTFTPGTFRGNLAREFETVAFEIVRNPVPLHVQRYRLPRGANPVEKSRTKITDLISVSLCMCLYVSIYIYIYTPSAIYAANCAHGGTYRVIEQSARIHSAPRAIIDNRMEEPDRLSDIGDEHQKVKRSAQC